MNRKVVVVGGGTAGLIAALTLLKLCERIDITIVRSTKIGHIMVGEGTVGSTPGFFHDVLEISKRDFISKVNPTWKLGVRFLWGDRPFFDYTFTAQFLNQILPSTKKPLAYYFLHTNWEGISEASELMSQNKLLCGENVAGEKRLPKNAAYHFENEKFVSFLEQRFVQQGGKLLDATITQSSVSENGIDSVSLDTGEQLLGDFFIDASGFSGLLIHKALGEPYISMRDHLFCNQAIVGGWEREDGEVIKPYTTAETMSSGWCWQIEHEHLINRGYVHSSDFISDDQAAGEFLQKNPSLHEKDLRLVPFESRYIRNPWVKNVVAIGNACGFVEPLEATNIQVICSQSTRFARVFNLESKNQTLISEYNQSIQSEWGIIRDFLALHYRFNTRFNTPFWKMATNETPLGDIQSYIEFYQNTGPNTFSSRFIKKQDPFGYEGYLSMLLGMKVPWKGSDKTLTKGEIRSLKNVRQSNVLKAMRGISSEQLLSEIKSSKWLWN